MADTVIRPNFNSPVSVYENIAFGMRVHTPRHQLKRSVADEAVEKSLSELGLWSDLKDHLRQEATTL